MTSGHDRGLAAVILIMHAVVLLALPLALPALPTLGWLVLLTLPPAVTQWGLIHEGIHKHLHPDTAVNDRWARALGISMGASFHVLRFGHLMHHKLNRHWHGEQVAQPGWRASLRYYANLFFGLYLGEVVTSLMLTFLPRATTMRLARATFLNEYPQVAVAAERYFYQRNHVALVRRDMLVMLAGYGVSAVLYGPFWPVLAAYLLGRTVVISFLDNVYHYDTPADNSKAGKELQLAPALSRWMLHGNYHETHHLNPDVPWRQLPRVHENQQRHFDGVWMHHALMQLRVPQARGA